MTICITILYRIIITIGECVTPDDCYSRARKVVCINEPANLRVIIPAFEVVHLQLGIVVISPVPQGVDAGQITGGGEELAPGFVGVGGDGGSAGVEDAHHVALPAHGPATVVQGVANAVVVTGHIAAFNQERSFVGKTTLFCQTVGKINVVSSEELTNSLVMLFFGKK